MTEPTVVIDNMRPLRLANFQATCFQPVGQERLRALAPAGIRTAGTFEIGNFAVMNESEPVDPKALRRATKTLFAAKMERTATHGSCDAPDQESRSALYLTVPTLASNVGICCPDGW